MKKMLMIAAIVCAALMTSCVVEKKSDDKKTEKTEKKSEEKKSEEKKSEEKKSEKDEKTEQKTAVSSNDFVGTWKMAEVGVGEIEIIATLNGDGKGEFVRLENGQYDGTFEITKWFYDGAKTAITIITSSRGETQVGEYKIIERSAGGDEMCVTLTSQGETATITMTRVK